MRIGHYTIVLALALAIGHPAHADTLSFTGSITQSVPDGTGPAVNNPALNDIGDGDIYRVDLAFNGAVTSAGTYNGLSGVTLSFSDLSASVTEAAFSSVGLTISQTASALDFSVFGCLTTGTSCDAGNFLSASFEIPAGQLNSLNISASPIPLLTPALNLSEDDGATNIFGSTTGYSYVVASAVPSPPSWILLAVGMAGLAWRARYSPTRQVFGSQSV